MDHFEILERSLRDGAKMHAFRSGGGLRVVRIENPAKKGDDKLIGYGESVNVDEALQHVAEDYQAGGREYEEVYGKIHPHYLTGSNEAPSPLDAFIFQGHTFDAWADGGEYVVQLGGLEMVHTPKHIVKEGMTKAITWKDRGFTYETAPSKFPNGERCTSTSVIDAVPGKDPWSYSFTQTGRAKRLKDAFDAALAASRIEKS